MKKFVFVFIFMSLCCNVVMAQTNSKKMIVKEDVGMAIEDAFENAFVDMFYPDETSKYEIGYTYSSIAPANTLFPVGLYGEYAYDWVAFSSEIAVNVSNKSYLMPKSVEVTYDPILYWMAGLGVNFNVLSINFNAGIVNYKCSSTQKVEAVSDEISLSLLTTTQYVKVAAIMQPSIHLHIPVNDEFQYFISLKVGYNICPSLKDFNGLNIGLGFGGWLY